MKNVCKICTRPINAGDIGCKCRKKFQSDKAKQLEDIRRQKSLQYANARESIVPDIGEDFKGAMRHRVNRLSFAEVEKLPVLQANQYLMRKNLIKNDPPQLKIEQNEAYKIYIYDAVLKAIPQNNKNLKHFDIKKFPVYVVFIKYKNSRDEESLTIFHIALSIRSAEYAIKEYSGYLKGTNKEMFFKEINTQEELDSILRGNAFSTYENLKEIIESDSLIERTGTNREKAKASLEAIYQEFTSRCAIKMQSGRRTKNVLGENDLSIARALSKLREKDPINEATKINLDLNAESFNIERVDQIGLAVKEIDKSRNFSGKERVKAFDPIIFYSNQTVERIGPNIKAKTIDDHIRDLETKLMFRGVQNGKSVKDSERLRHFAELNTAMHDLMDILNIKDHKKMSFGGTLGIAMGSFSGVKNSMAHYRSEDGIISFTRKSGIGALAHEWGHALDDHYGKKKNRRVFTNTNCGIDNETNFSAKAESFRKRMVSSSDYAKYPEKHRKYLNDNKEVFARIFEAMIKRKLEKAGRKNTYLVSCDENCAYPTNEELDAMESDFDKTIEMMLR